mmetsp:Transcript_24136/g.48266  ORF Transcript_24136/g.48266 Transcript_24136/m.48266 type:complete len:317 (+) Transcript_24136:208-1158(+)
MLAAPLPAPHSTVTRVLTPRPSITAMLITRSTLISGRLDHRHHAAKHPTGVAIHPCSQAHTVASEARVAMGQAMRSTAEGSQLWRRWRRRVLHVEGRWEDGGVTPRTRSGAASVSSHVPACLLSKRGLSADIALSLARISLALARLPDLNLLIIGARVEGLARLVDGDGAHKGCVAKECRARVGLEIPNLELRVGAAGVEGRVPDGEASDDALVSDEHVRLLHRVEVPHPYLVVEAAAVDGVVGHGEGVDLRARGECEDALHVLEIPYLDGVVLGGGGEHILLRGEGADPRGVRLERLCLRDQFEVPHLDRLVVGA